MKSLKQLLYFFIILFVSSSILIDWNGYSFESNPNTIQTTMFTDEYEDHNLQISHLTVKHFWGKISNRRMWIDDFYEKYISRKIPITYNVNSQFIDIRCAVKSFLHLLQFF